MKKCTIVNGSVHFHIPGLYISASTTGVFNVLSRTTLPYWNNILESAHEYQHGSVYTKNNKKSYS